MVAAPTPDGRRLFTLLLSHCLVLSKLVQRAPIATGCVVDSLYCWIHLPSVLGDPPLPFELLLPQMVDEALQGINFGCNQLRVGG